jgi:methionyl-tRNA formyltransferase
VIRTVFLGSGGFAVPSLATLAGEAALEIISVVTAPPRPVGRRQVLQPTPVGHWATEHGLALLTPERLRSHDSVAQVANLGPDLLVLADYGQIVPAALLELPRHGALNLHPSLLPRHRGASPIQATILAGDRETGVSLMLMDEGLDSGPLVAQRAVALEGSETAPELEERLAALAAQLLSESLVAWLDGTLAARAQPVEGVSLTRPLRRSDGLLDPARPVLELERKVRAYQPWPGTYIERGGDRLAVWRARVADVAPAAAPGDLVPTGGGGVGLVAADGTLELLEVQPAGGRRMSGQEYVRGRPGVLRVR